jgi:hypothetical protein
MTRFAMTGLLLLLPALGLAACGGGDAGTGVPAGYKSVEIGGMRLILPADLPVDDSPSDGSLFIARPPGVLAQHPRVGGKETTSDESFLNVVSDIAGVNTSGLKDFAKVSDVALDVPGSDVAHRVVNTFLAGEQEDIPTTRTTVVAKKGKRYFLLTAVVPDSKRGELNVDTIVKSLELT